MTEPAEGDDERAFSFLQTERAAGRSRAAAGVTEIRGPYYTPMGKRYLRGRAGDDGRRTWTR